MKWAVEIQKTSLGRRNLADLLEGLGFSLVDGIEFSAFTSPSIEGCGTAEQVFELAKQLRSAFKGAAQIDPQFVLGSVIDYSINPPRRHAFLEVESIISTMSVGSATLTVSPPKGLSGQELETWQAEQAEREYQSKLEGQRSRLEPAFWSPRAKKVLELLAIEHPSGETIYKIYELAEGHPSNRGTFQARFGVSADQFGRFKDAVHNPTVSGDWARHAYEDSPKTTYPMSKDEAERFVRQIASKWLENVRANKSDS
jgi:hypothetical protein